MWIFDFLSNLIIEMYEKYYETTYFKFLYCEMNSTFYSTVIKVTL